MRLIESNAEIKRHNSSVTVQLEVESIQSFLDDAENTHIIPAIGREAFTALVNDKAGYTESSKQKTLLLILQKACVNFALHYYADNGALVIDDSGIAVLYSEKKRPASDKKLLAFKRQCLSVGYNSLELAISYLEANVNDFAEYKTSAERIENRSRFINSSREFPQKMPVSAALYATLKAIITNEEDSIIANMLGDTFLSSFRTKFLANTLSATESALLKKIRDVIGSNTLLKGITYKLVDVQANGSYIHHDTVGGISGNVENKEPAELDRLRMINEQLRFDAAADLERLRKFLKDNAANLTGYVVPAEVTINDPDSNIYFL